MNAGDPSQRSVQSTGVADQRSSGEFRIGNYIQKIRKALRVISWGYFLAAVVSLLVIRWCGERTWITGTLLYLPPTAALLPFVFLTPLCWLFCRRWCWTHLLVLLLVFCVYQHPRFSMDRHAAGQTVRVVTNNVGQRKSSPVKPFLQAHDPDLMAFQEADRLDRFFRSEYPDRFVSVQGEFALVSRWPIKKAGVVPGIFSHWGAAAAWFEIERDGQRFIVYNVHMPTPRPQFLKLRGQGFLIELARMGGIYSSKIRAEYSKAMKDRVETGRKLAEVFEKEKRPFIALGDFNMPDTGYLHGLFASELTDVFAAKGTGYGLTFPGFTRSPLSFFGPWLRIDYIFTGKNWRPLDCEVEPKQNAQHLGIVADLELLNDNSR